MVQARTVVWKHIEETWVSVNKKGVPNVKGNKTGRQNICAQEISCLFIIFYYFY